MAAGDQVAGRAFVVSVPIMVCAGLPDVPWTLLKTLKRVPQLFTWQLCLSYSACKQFGHAPVLTSHAPGKSKMLKCNMLVEAPFPGFTELGLEG